MPGGEGKGSEWAQSLDKQTWWWMSLLPSESWLRRSPAGKFFQNWVNQKQCQQRLTSCGFCIDLKGNSLRQFHVSLENTTTSMMNLDICHMSCFRKNIWRGVGGRKRVSLKKIPFKIFSFFSVLKRHTITLSSKWSHSCLLKGNTKCLFIYFKRSFFGSHRWFTSI